MKYSVAAMLGALAMEIVMIFCAQEHLHNEAVKHHAAEYYLDSNSERQWRWLDEPKKP